MEINERGTGGAEDQNGLLPIFRSLSRQRMLILCCNYGPRSRHGSQARRTTRPGRARHTCVLGWDARATVQCTIATVLSSFMFRQGSPFRDTVPGHAVWVGSR